MEKHYEELLDSCIGYLWEIWNNIDIDTIKENFERLGFTKEDMDNFYITQELEYIEENCREWESDK